MSDRTVRAMAALLVMTIVAGGGTKRAQADEVADQAASANKMTKISIALINYHDTYRRFPQANTIGKDGKTPHSWRVELLPYLDRNDVYERYHMDEPWDSEHNLALVPEAAELFAVPGDKNGENCGYFLVTGPGTLFDGKPKPSIRIIRDGTSNTIGLVEAKGSIAWTQPVDFEIAPDKPLPALGGFCKEGFHVGFFDGSVVFLPTGFDEATLRACFTISGREKLKRELTTGEPVLEQP